MNHPSDSTRAGAWWTVGIWMVVVIVAVILAFQARHRQIHSLASIHPTDINDFNRWLRMLPGFLHGNLAIHNTRWPMPPLTILLLSPFSLMSFPTAQFVWVMLKLLLVALIFYCGLEIVRQAGGRIGPWPLLLILLAWMWPVIGDMQEGQMNLLMLAPMMLGLWLAQKETPFSDVAGGLGLALAVAIKITPIIFLVYMLWRRRWRVAAAMAIGVLVWFYLPLALAFGWRQAVLWNHQYLQVMILPYVVHGAVQVSRGESLPSFLLRLLAHVPAFTTYRHGITKAYYVNLLDLDPEAARLIIRALLVAIGVAGLYWMRRRLPTLRSRRYVLEIGAVVVFMLVGEEWSWVPHYVSLLPALLAAGMIVCDPAVNQASRRRAFLALAAAALLMVLTSDIIKIFGPNADNYGRTCDPAMLAGILLVLAIMTGADIHRAPHGQCGGLSPPVDQPPDYHPLRRERV